MSFTPASEKCCSVATECEQRKGDCCVAALWRWCECASSRIESLASTNRELADEISLLVHDLGTHAIVSNASTKSLIERGNEISRRAREEV